MTQEDRSAIAVLAARFIRSGRTEDIMGLAAMIEDAVDRKLTLIANRHRFLEEDGTGKCCSCGWLCSGGNRSTCRSEWETHKAMEEPCKD